MRSSRTSPACSTPGRAARPPPLVPSSAGSSSSSQTCCWCERCPPRGRHRAGRRQLLGMTVAGAGAAGGRTPLRGAGVHRASRRAAAIGVLVGVVAYLVGRGALLLTGPGGLRPELVARLGCRGFGRSALAAGARRRLGSGSPRRRRAVGGLRRGVAADESASRSSSVRAPEVWGSTSVPSPSGLVARGAHDVTVLGPADTEERFGFTATGADFTPVEISTGTRPDRDSARSRAAAARFRGVDVVHAHGLRAGIPRWTLGRRAPLGLHLAQRRARRRAAWSRVRTARADRRSRQRTSRSRCPRTWSRRARALGAHDVRLAIVPAPGSPASRLRCPPSDPLELGAGARPIVLTVARLQAQKGQRALLDAAQAWEDREPSALRGARRRGTGPTQRSRTELDPASATGRAARSPKRCGRPAGRRRRRRPAVPVGRATAGRPGGASCRPPSRGHRRRRGRATWSETRRSWWRTATRPSSGCGCCPGAGRPRARATADAAGPRTGCSTGRA